MLTSLWTRLMWAGLFPMVLVTALLYPIFNAQLDDRTARAQVTAATTLEAEYERLRQTMNESLNQVLVTVELPLLQRYLDTVQQTQSPAHEVALQRDLEQMDALFRSLLTHFGRYTRLALIDQAGRERLSATTLPMPTSPPKVDHADTALFEEATALQSGDLYVSPPRLGDVDGDGTVTAAIDIATPVFTPSGRRLGVLLFTLDWSRLTANLVDTHEHSDTQFLLTDARGSWLLAGGGEQAIPFGSALATEWPAAWQAMAASYRGEAKLDKHLLEFHTHDVRIHHYQSQAGMIVSDPDTQPWRLGIATPRPTLMKVLMESRGQLMAIVLVYLLSITVAALWTFGHYRQRSLRQSALLLSRQARQYAGEVQDLYENAPCGYHSLDSAGRVVKMNRTELDWLGYRADEIIGRRLYRDFITPGSRDAFDAAFQQVLSDAREGAAECELLCRDGTSLPVAIQATAQVTAAGFQYSRATVFDLRERKRLEASLERQAMTDPLTGLGNRRYLEDQAAMEIARAQRSGAPLSLIAIDLDHFKYINDTHGHDVGDLVLQAFAGTARQQLRNGDVLCRMGGEEFAILLPDTTREQAMKVAERLRQTIAGTPVEVGEEVIAGGRLAYSASLGVTLVSAGESSLKPAIKRADRGLYAAKAAGRNRTQWHAG
ncbi:diguanylate cyclase [Halomonas mongoliensis]|uniref:diguanylate cyclase n=1 Tax=Halomonas mongoliensis TaxID=321265 RepID=UPI00403B388F